MATAVTNGLSIAAWLASAIICGQYTHVGVKNTCRPTGLVNAFTGMAAGGATGGLAGISAGIAEALITTAFGLLVAIPAVWAYNYFTTKIENLTVEMTYSAKELIDYLIKSVGSEFGRSIFTKEFQAQKAVTGSGHVHG